MRREHFYAELQTTTNFSFLQGASHPHEYVWRAAELGYSAIAITDTNSLAGIVRAHTAARDAGIQLIVGCKLEIDFQGYCKHSLDDRSSPYHRSSLLVYPTNRESYGILCELLSKGRAPVSKNDFFIDLADFLSVQRHFVTIAIPPFFQTRLHTTHSSALVNTRGALFFDLCKILRENSTDRAALSISLTHNYGPSNKHFIQSSIGIARALDISLVATNDAYYHIPERAPLQDVLTSVRAGTTIQQLGFKRFQNGERYLKTPAEMHRLFRETPTAITRTTEIAEMTAGFSLSSLTYTYPDGICPPSSSPAAYLRAETLRGASERYPLGIPLNVRKGIEDELRLIGELSYEKYFLTCYDIVSFAKSRGILCQGRGAAANSIVCFCLGITAVDPQQIDLLFARFISKERQEPPDIDIDFEHERREEVIQYIYEKYGRDKAALTAEVVTYQARSAIRDVCKAFGISLDVTDKLATSVHRWTGSAITADSLRELGLNPYDHTIQNALTIANDLIGFPRHLSQHVGGFIISQTPLNQIVPIINAGMAYRTIIEWDKNDIEELGMLKIDILALGMLSCIRKALELINAKRAKTGDTELALYSIPRDDRAVYDMLCASDTVGVFQVESRAQMAMLPRLRPRVFYDLVIEVAIVRPGPIQGNMVHPYLRRRSGAEKPFYPDERVQRILGKTLGVPIFQEQAMRLAIVLANFTPGEAEKLRRAMAAWKTHKGVIETFKAKITEGMLANGYSREFAETCLNQIKGFSEYGFPESHAASFALLVYASAWIKRHYPTEFACALLNSQPMGFYAPAQIVRDAQRHGVRVLPIDANKSEWNCSLVDNHLKTPALRLGLRLVRGLRHDHALALRESIDSRGEFLNVEELWNRSSGVSHASLRTLTHADAFQSLDMKRRESMWDLQALTSKPAPLDAFFEPRSRPSLSHLPQTSAQQEMFQDYKTTGLSLKAHPLDFLRPILTRRHARSAHELGANFGIRVGTTVSAAGLVITRQRPGTAKGVVFLTLEDETGSLNIVIRPSLFDANRASIMNSSVLLVTGKLERVGEVIYIDAQQVVSLDQELMGLARRRG